MKTIKVGGVPEHFNMPWHYGVENHFFRQANLDLQWTDFPAGTGAMTQALRNGELDVAVLLTEGIVADILRGNPAKLVQFFVKSPLIWGIHVAEKSDIQEVSQMSGKRYAISRLGSGSHLMAYIHAAQQGFSVSENQLVVVNNMAGAEKALTAGEADLFLWEKFMTQPLVDKGVFRRIGDVLTPWSCFAIAVRNEFLSENEESVRKMLAVINQITQDFKTLPGLSGMIAEKFHLQEKEVKNWLQTVEWANDSVIHLTEIESVIQTLSNLKIVEQKRPAEQMIHVF
jgi:sulfonate transport system substrate-binding protein